MEGIGDGISAGRNCPSDAGADCKCEPNFENRESIRQYKITGSLCGSRYFAGEIYILLKKFLEFIHESIYIFEFPIYRGESYVSDRIQFL